MEIERISKEELSCIKGGIWFYDENTGKWYWIAEKATPEESQVSQEKVDYKA